MRLSMSLMGAADGEAAWASGELEEAAVCAKAVGTAASAKPAAPIAAAIMPRNRREHRTRGRCAFSAGWA